MADYDAAYWAIVDKWHYLGDIVCKDGVTRRVHLFIDGDWNAWKDGIVGVRLLLKRANDPSTVPTKKQTIRRPEDFIAALASKAALTPEEKAMIFDSVQSRCEFDGDPDRSKTTEEVLFEELMSSCWSAWKCVGSRSGNAILGPYHTSIYARRKGDGPVWKVMEWGEGSPYQCEITDDGSGKSIYWQYMNSHYPDELGG